MELYIWLCGAITNWILRDILGFDSVRAQYTHCDTKWVCVLEMLQFIFPSGDEYDMAKAFIQAI